LSELLGFGYGRDPVVGMDEVHVGSRHQFGLCEAKCMSPGWVEAFEVPVVSGNTHHVD
jgi:hypothetical protein